jgi:predicted CoA-binding protein
VPSRQTIDRFLAQQHLAFVGVSRDPKHFANSVYRLLRDGGRTMYPVNASADVDTIEGDRCYQHLADVPDPIDGVVVMVPGANSADVVRNAVDRGIPRVWLHRGFGPGSVTPEAVALCEEYGVEVVDGACPFMFAEPVRGVHRLHRFFVRRRVAA